MEKTSSLSRERLIDLQYEECSCSFFHKQFDRTDRFYKYIILLSVLGRPLACPVNWLNGKQVWLEFRFPLYKYFSVS